MRRRNKKRKIKSKAREVGKKGKKSKEKEIEKEKKKEEGEKNIPRSTDKSCPAGSNTAHTRPPHYSSTNTHHWDWFPWCRKPRDHSCTTRWLWDNKRLSKCQSTFLLLEKRKHTVTARPVRRTGIILNNGCSGKKVSLRDRG